MAGCQGKVRFKTRDGAERVMASKVNSCALNVYHCKECGKYHIGHARGWRRQKPAW
jgi:uncharacterized protein with PIN domain